MNKNGLTDPEMIECIKHGQHNEVYGNWAEAASNDVKSTSYKRVRTRHPHQR